MLKFAVLGGTSRCRDFKKGLRRWRAADRLAGIDLRLEPQPEIEDRADVVTNLSGRSWESVPLPSSLQTLTFGCLLNQRLEGVTLPSS